MAQLTGQLEYSITPLGASGPRIYWGSAAPTTGTYVTGDLFWNSNPGVNSPLGWQCISGGTPGTWIPYTYIQNSPNLLTTTVTAQTLATGYRTYFYNGAAASISLPDVTLFQTGAMVTVKNIANVSLTLSAVATNSYADAAAITLTQNQFINLVGNSTLWYKIG